MKGKTIYAIKVIKNLSFLSFDSWADLAAKATRLICRGKIMFAHRTIKILKDLHLQIDLPVEFTDYKAAEIIVLPVISSIINNENWESRVLALAGTLGDDFPDDVDISDLGNDSPRDSLA